MNYSSIRAGLVDEREFYKAVQRWFIATCLHQFLPYIIPLRDALSLTPVLTEFFKSP